MFLGADKRTGADRRLDPPHGTRRGGSYPARMVEKPSPAHGSAQALRERAQWYRDWAEVASGGNKETWLALAARFERMAEELEGGGEA